MGSFFGLLQGQFGLRVWDRGIGFKVPGLSLVEIISSKVRA